jgi:sialate O-acetylesterase
MRLNQLPLTFVILLFLITGLQADVSLPGMFGDNMVLQSDKTVPVWGWAEPGEKITVKCDRQKAVAIADQTGKWRVQLEGLKPDSRPTIMTVAGRNAITFTNVLVGEVWLGSGQSNMEMAMKDITNSKEEMASATNSSIRLFTVPRLFTGIPTHDVEAKWIVCSPENIKEFSATLYLFGREIVSKTKRPLGLIHSSVGGTRIELWTAPEGLPDSTNVIKALNQTIENYRKELPAQLAEFEKWTKKAKAALVDGADIPPAPEMRTPGSLNPLYNGMIHPLVPFAIRGAVWYQGEWNGGEDEVYHQRMKTLVAGWRSVWNMPEMPFYYVQLARMPEKDHSPWLGNGLAPTRDAQRRSLDIPHTGMAVIIDLEGSSGWHPGDKQDVGLRLSLWALRNEYGMKDLACSGPLYKSMTVEGNRIRIKFDNVGSGLMIASKTGVAPIKRTPDQKLNSFAIAGSDPAAPAGSAVASNRWFNASATIDGNDVLVSAPEVPNPVAVRYAYCNDPEGCNLYNKEELPASPFRTDNW